MKKMKFIAVVFALCLSVLPAVSWAGIMNGKAPQFTLRDINGNYVSLSDLKGKVVFIDFWASWCAPCKKELPELNRFSAKYGNDAVFLAVNVDKIRSNAEDFLLKLNGISPAMKVLLDTDTEVIAKYNVAAMPTSFILDRQGVVRYAHFGFREIDPASWAQEIEHLLK